jgi:hypothetical protein
MDQVEPEVDEQGAPWPPTHCPLAKITGYGGSQFSPFNGVLVELGAYLKDQGYFEAALTEMVMDSKRHEVGEVVLVKVEELTDLTSYTQAYVKEWTEQSVDVYTDEVYELRDDLASIGIVTLADSVFKWSAEQRRRMRVHVNAVIFNSDPANSVPIAVPPIPEDLP